jgi:hypothetical protein
MSKQQSAKDAHSESIRKQLHELLDDEVATFGDDGEEDYNVEFRHLTFADELINKITSFVATQVNEAEKAAMLRQRAYDERLVNEARIDELNKVMGLPGTHSPQEAEYFQKRIKELQSLQARGSSHDASK